MAIIKFWTRALDFRGRSSRGEFWLGYLVDVLPIMYLTSYESLFESLGQYMVFSVTVIVIMLWMLLGMISSAVRRLRDAGKNPLCILLWFVPIGNIVLLVFLCMPTAECTSMR